MQIHKNIISNIEKVKTLLEIFLASKVDTKLFIKSDVNSCSSFQKSFNGAQVVGGRMRSVPCLTKSRRAKMADGDFNQFKSNSLMFFFHFLLWVTFAL